MNDSGKVDPLVICDVVSGGMRPTSNKPALILEALRLGISAESHVVLCVGSILLFGSTGISVSTHATSGSPILAFVMLSSVMRSILKRPVSLEAFKSLIRASGN